MNERANEIDLMIPPRRARAGGVFTALSARIAQAVADDLGAHAFPRAFTAVRAYLPHHELGEFDTCRVTVLVAGRTLEPAARGWLQLDHRIDVAVQERLASDESAAIDPLLELVEAIADHLANHLLVAAPEARWVKSEHAPLIAAEHLNEFRQFTSVLTLTYRTWEAS